MGNRIRTDSGAIDGATPAGAALSAVAAFSPTAEPAAAPAGGTGMAAGGWDTAGNRDIAITTINDSRTRIEESKIQIDNLKARLDEVESRLQAFGLVA